MKGFINAFGKTMSDSDYVESRKNAILKRLNNVKEPKLSKRQKRRL